MPLPCRVLSLCQRLKEENLRETEKCKAEKDLLRGKSEELEKHLRVANFQLEVRL